MTPFPAFDGGRLLDPVQSLASPLGGELRFSRPLERRAVGMFWAHWAHGYMGNVYAGLPDGGPGPWGYDLILPPERRAFYFYTQIDPSGIWGLRVTTEDGQSRWEWSHMSDGARGFGVYLSDPSDPPLTSIRVDTEWPGYLAAGEFGIAIPEPGTLLTLSLGSLGFLRRRASATGPHGSRGTQRNG